VTRRPIAGQRSREKLGATGRERPERQARTAGSAPRTAVLDRPATPPPVDDPAPARGRPRRRSEVLVLVALAVVVGLAVTAGLLVLRARGEERVEAARTAAQAAGEQHAVTLLSYDHRHLDRDFDRARDVLTGSFADDYAETTEKVVRPTAEQVKAVVTAEVVSSSVVRASADRVVLLLFVDQTTTSTRLDGPKVDLNRVRMTLTRAGGQWLVSAVDAL
jgi:Mce-associated membrane protein